MKTKRYYVKTDVHGNASVISSLKQAKDAVTLKDDENYIYHEFGKKAHKLYCAMRDTYGSLRKVRWIVEDGDNVYLTTVPQLPNGYTTLWYISRLEDDATYNLFVKWLNKAELKVLFGSTESEESNGNN